MPVDFLWLEHVLSNAECEFVIEYGHHNLDRLAGTNPAKDFTGKVLLSTQMPSEVWNLAVLKVAKQVKAELQSKYQTKHIYIESVMLNRWQVGDALANHADNAYADTGLPNLSRHRTYSAVLYLNDGFGGGDFYFANGPEVRPKRGCVVAFPAGLTHIHGVTRVTEGVRWTLPMWFSARPSDEDRILAGK